MEISAQVLRLGNLIQDKDGNIENVFELSIFGNLHRINELDPEFLRSHRATVYLKSMPKNYHLL